MFTAKLWFDNLIGVGPSHIHSSPVKGTQHAMKRFGFVGQTATQVKSAQNLLGRSRRYRDGKY